MSDNIKVAIKVRPLIKREQDERLPIQWIVEDNSILQIDPATNRRRDAEFQFDYIFDMGRSNQDVFDATVKPIVEAAMRGFNGTIFAYGQTGSGKTYTMMGTKEERGVIPLAVDYIFNYIRNDPDREFLLRVSYIEIYNEKINDLLDKNRVDLKIKEDYHGHISIDCKEEVTNSATCVLGAMKKGDKNRRTGETNMNDRSSRSHTLFRITIESCSKDDPDGTANEAQLNLIDLAGSERARQTGATGERFNEGRHINLSLSTLSLVIKQLSESQAFINFRDSKLTRILQPSLGGNAMTAIICAVTPAADDETQCTLAFAVRAKGIKNKPQVNENISDKALLKRIRTQKSKLEAEMASMKTEMAEKDKQISLGRIALLNMQIISCNSQHEEEFKLKARRRRTWAGSSSGGPILPGKGFALPTIDECELKPEAVIDELIQPRDIYDVMNQSFQTPYADFELQLIEDQREKNRLSNGSDGGFVAPTVTIRPRNTVEDVDDENTNICSPERTPERYSSSSDPSPTTPKVKLRRDLESLRSEYETLREFTTLEKQLLQSDRIAAANQAQYEQNLSFVTRSLADSEQMCKDLNKKYAELQSDHGILAEKYVTSERKCAILEEEVQSLSSLRTTLTSVEAEKDDYKSKMNAALTRLKTLEDESNSHTFEIDVLKNKHKIREKELEASLNVAWQEFSDLNAKQQSSDIDRLQSVIAELTTKVKSLETQLQFNNNASSASLSEEDFILKIDELNNSLKQSQRESMLKAKLSPTAERIRTISETTLRNEFQSQIEEYTKRIQNLEEIIAQKDLELASNSNHQLALKFNETTEKLQFYERCVDEMKINIERLQSDLDKKSNEVCEIKSRLDATLRESEEASNNTHLQLTTSEEQLHAALSTIEVKELKIQELEKILLDKCKETSETNARKSSSGENKLENSILANLQNDNNDNLMRELEERDLEIAQLKQRIEELSTNSESTIKCHQDRINEILATNDKLRDQIANIQSERTIYDGDRISMQTLLQEKDDKLQMIPKLQGQLDFVMAEKIELERIINDQRTQLNEKILAMEKMHNYESEIDNLNSYKENLQSFVKKLQNENEEMKKQLHSQADALEMLESEKKLSRSNFEPLKISSPDNENIEILSRCENVISNTPPNELKFSSRICQVVKPLNMTTELPQSEKKMKAVKTLLDVTQDDKESSSIFANGSYFDNMDASVVASEVIDSSCIQNLSNFDCTMNDTTIMESKSESDNSKVLLNLTCDELENRLSQKTAEELTSIVRELLNLKMTLEEENAKLVMNLRSKMQEIFGIRKDFGAFKLDFEKLQQSISLLTTENLEMAVKLATEKERANEIEMEFQKNINELQSQIDTLTVEKQAQEMHIKMLQDKVDDFEKSVAQTDDEKIREMCASYENRIKILTDENIDLSNNLMEKIEELENMKDKEGEKCGDDCDFREKWEHVMERAKILENENVDLSENLVSKIETLEILTEEYENLKANMHENSSHLGELPKKVDALVNLADELKMFITKLADPKLMCNCTTQQTELSEAKQAIMNNMELLNTRWYEFQDNFERARTEAEKLTNKAHQDMSVSIHETSMNCSVHENIDITFVEEKVQRLQTDFETLHDSLQKWTMLNEKNSDTEKTRDNNSSVHDISRHSPCESPRTSKRDAKIDRRQCELEKYKIEQQQLAKTISAFEKFQNNMTHMQHEIKTLRAARETYEKKIKIAEESTERAQQRVLVLEDDVKTLNIRINQLHDDNKKLEELKSNLEKEIENLNCEKSDYEENYSELRQSLIEAKDSNVSLQEKLEELKSVLETKIQDLTNSLHNSEERNSILKSELETIKSTPIPEREQVTDLTSKLQKYKESFETMEISVKELHEKLLRSAKENANLSERITELEAQVNKTNMNVSDHNMEVCDESFSQNSVKDKSIEELIDARARITKEIATLQETEVKNFDGKSLSELFSVFLTTLMTKEHEIIKTLRRGYDREKQELVEKNKQSVDAEKRSALWAKALEADIERLQNDITKQETKNTTLAAQISKLENLLLDSDHEKQLLREKITVMETDFNTLQADYEKYSKSNPQSDDAVNEREKSLQKALEIREVEFKNRLTKVENEHKQKIEDLSISLEVSKTKNMDLKKELEALEANERQLKSIIDLKCSELVKSNSTIQRLQDELKELSNIYNQTSDDNNLKSQKIDEITALLKTKCDKMSEYKTHLETIKPEYEMLKAQASERQLRLETYKSEMEKLSEESKQHILSLKDQLDSQQIKSTVLNKQLADITNRNTILQSELEQLKNECQEIQRENERLMKKMRNSTSKLTVEREMEDLRDANRTHLKNLEGATNRIVELQKHKSQLMIEHAELQGRYENVCRENIELKTLLDRNKNAYNNKSELYEKYDTLLQEKNKIALELEEKRSTMIKLEANIVRLTNDNIQLRNKNVELDAEMDDIVQKIHDMDAENTELQRKIYELGNDNKMTDSNKKSSVLNNSILNHSKLLRHEEIKKELEVMTMTNELLKKENVELRSKIGNKYEGKSCGSSRSTSPTPTNRSRQRRSDLFNQNRPLDGDDEEVIVPPTDCRCDDLRKQIRKLEQDLVSKQAKIGVLQMQIKSEMFPYEAKCKELEDAMLEYQKRNFKLTAEIKELRTKKVDCVRCTSWTLYRRDESTQTLPEKPIISLSGSSRGGIVEEHTMEEMQTAKLERDKSMLKTKLKRKVEEIQKYKEQIKDLQVQLEMNAPAANKVDKNFKHVMKENVPANIAEQTKLIVPQRNWLN